MALSIGVGLAALAGTAPPALAAPGELDTGFGVNGRLIQNIDTNVVPSTDLARDVVVQPDGRIVVAGSTFVNNKGSITNAGFAVLRLTSAGLPDESTGFPVFSEGAYPGNGAAAVALEPDGKILLAGTNGSMGSDFIAARISGVTGNYDPVFGPPNGWAPLDFSGVDGAGVGTDGVYDMVRQPNGAIVMAGYSDNQFAVGQGGLDGGAGRQLRRQRPQAGRLPRDRGGGHLRRPLGHRRSSPPATSANRPTTSSGSSASTPAVPRTRASGSAPGGRPAGSVEIPHGAEAIAVRPDGKVLVAGPANGDFGIGQVKTDGFYDPAFGVNGQVTVDLGGNDVPYAMELQPDGKILVAGTDGDGFAITRLMPGGSVDTGFGVNGRASVNFGGVDEALGIALQPDGKIVLVGTNGADFAVTRLLGDPAPPSAGFAGEQAAPEAVAKRLEMRRQEGDDRRDRRPQTDSGEPAPPT